MESLQQNELSSNNQPKRECCCSQHAEKLDLGGFKIGHEWMGQDEDDLSLEFFDECHWESAESIIKGGYSILIRASTEEAPRIIAEAANKFGVHLYVNFDIDPDDNCGNLYIAKRDEIVATSVEG